MGCKRGIPVNWYKTAQNKTFVFEIWQKASIAPAVSYEATAHFYARLNWGERFDYIYVDLLGEPEKDFSDHKVNGILEFNVARLNWRFDFDFKSMNSGNEFYMASVAIPDDCRKAVPGRLLGDGVTKLTVNGFRTKTDELPAPEILRRKWKPWK